MTEEEIKVLLKTKLKHKDKEILFSEFRDIFESQLLPVNFEEFTEKRKKEDDFELLSQKISDGNMILEQDEEYEEESFDYNTHKRI